MVYLSPSSCWGSVGDLVVKALRGDLQGVQFGEVEVFPTSCINLVLRTNCTV